MVNVEINNENKIKSKTFQELWSELPRNLRGQYRRDLLSLLRIPESTFYQRLNSDSFLAHERAIIAAYLNIPQQSLFPNQPVVFENVHLNLLKL